LGVIGLVSAYCGRISLKTGHRRHFQLSRISASITDLIVCAVLLVLCEIAPAALDLSSDGDMSGEEWQPARDFLRSLPPMPKSENVTDGEPFSETKTLFSMPLMEVTA